LKKEDAKRSRKKGAARIKKFIVTGYKGKGQKQKAKVIEKQNHILHKKKSFIFGLDSI